MDILVSLKVLCTTWINVKIKLFVELRNCNYESKVYVKMNRFIKIFLKVKLFVGLRIINWTFYFMFRIIN